jgi:hypothetical protein
MWFCEQVTHFPFPMPLGFTSYRFCNCKLLALEQLFVKLCFKSRTIRNVFTAHKHVNSFSPSHFGFWAVSSAIPDDIFWNKFEETFFNLLKWTTLLQIFSHPHLSLRENGCRWCRLLKSGVEWVNNSDKLMNQWLIFMAMDMEKSWTFWQRKIY